MAPAKSAKKKTRRSSGNANTSSSKTEAGEAVTARKTRSGGGTSAAKSKTASSSATPVGSSRPSKQQKIHRDQKESNDAASDFSKAFQKLGAGWVNGPGKPPTDSQAVIISSHGDRSQDEEDPDWTLDYTLDFLHEEGAGVLEKINYTNAIQAPFTDKNQPDREEIIHFKIGDRVWVLPDKQSFTVPSGYARPQDLPDQYWDVGEIINCCIVINPHDDFEGHFGFLEVVWLYTYEEALRLKGTNLHSSWLTKVKKYSLEDNERILTDHRDFVPLLSIAGFADGIFTRLRLHGLAVSAANRLKNAGNRPRRMVGDKVWIDGFENRKKGIEIKSPEAEKAARQATAAQQRREQMSKADAEDDEDEDEEGQDRQEQDRPNSNKKRRRKNRG